MRRLIHFIAVTCIAAFCDRQLTDAASPVEPVARFGTTHFRPQLSEKRRRGLSADGRWLAHVAARDLSLIDVYNLQDGSLKTTLRAEPTQNYACDLQFSTDGSRLYYADGEKWVLGWIVETGERVLRHACRNPIALGVSPDSQRLGVGMFREGLEVLELPSGKVRWRSPGKFSIDANAQPLLFSSDGSQLVGNSGMEFTMWNVADGVAKMPPRQPSDAGEVLGWNRELTGGLRRTANGNGLQVFHIEHAATVFEIPTLDGGYAAAYLGSSPEFAVQRACRRLEIEIWDSRTLQLARVLEPHSESVYELQASADGSTLIGRSASRIWVWDCQSGRLRDYCRGPCRITHIHFSPKSDLIAATGPSEFVTNCESSEAAPKVCPDGTRFWKRATSELVHSAPGWRFGGFSKSGQSAWLWKHCGEVREIDTATFAALRQAHVTLIDGALMRLAETAAVANNRIGVIEAFQIGETPAGTVFTIIRLPPQAIGHSTEGWVFGANWDAAAKVPLPVTTSNSEGDPGQVLSISMTPNGSRVALEYSWSETDAQDFNNGNRTSVGIYSHAAASRPLWINLGRQAVDGFALTSVGDSVLALVSPLERDDRVASMVCLWSATDGRLLREWNLKQQGIRLEDPQIAVNPNARSFVVGGADGAIFVWDLEREDDKMIATGRAHVGPITAIAYSLDGKWLSCGGQDGTLAVFDVEQLELPAKR